MIDKLEIDDWKKLQQKVCRILNDIGLVAEEERTVKTPRGKKEIDVFAFDPNSVDNIKYIIECKSWNRKINQSIVHAFTTVMHETGGNIGYLISNKGFQPGAKGYMKNTNISGLTFKEFQKKYLNIWIENYFIEEVFRISEFVAQYTQPINDLREKEVNDLSEEKKKKFKALHKKYSEFGNFLVWFNISNDGNSSMGFDINYSLEIEDIKENINNTLPKSDKIKGTTYRELLIELKSLITHITEKFNSLFNKNIFT